MNYDEAIKYIHGTIKFGVKLGLKNMERLLDLMGNPHKKLRYVHVAGTNGKGSTVAFISNILIEAGYKVGIYTSPYIERFTERIRINRSEISEPDLARITGFVKEKVDLMVKNGENHPTEFEIVTAIAFQYFYENSCDIVVLEVGLGGRYDSTNVIDNSLVSVITTINYDHMDKLGDTLEKIAFEKAGIIKEQGYVVIYPQPEEVENVIKKVCAEKRSNLEIVDFSQIYLTNFSIDGQVFDYGEYKSLEISLLGAHQIKNAAVAVSACRALADKGLNITEMAIRRGLANTRWPGRLEVLCRKPLFLLDGAHNPQGAHILRKALSEYFPDKRKIFIMGVLKDKDYKAMVEEISSIASRFIAVTPNSERALPAKELAILMERYCNNVLISDTIKEAIETSLDQCTSDDLICAFGSLYYIGEVRRFFYRGRCNYCLT
ncbi:MAG TPA: bifunctional folylpolyglutamate synthase/dihydrofolate synthase [Clostridiaceae bacterium]|nr:bifunctional folylpolyglutamate synthase/dihydrofolate synthase [Clostridiaceae bacterium]